MYGKTATTKSQRLADKGENVFAMHERHNAAVMCDSSCASVSERKMERKRSCLLFASSPILF